jgi:hypothetical protein
LRYHRSRFFTFLFFMQKLSGNSFGKNNKSYSTFHQESNKISFALLWFVYDFLRNLQVSAKGQTLFKNPTFTQAPGTSQFSPIHPQFTQNSPRRRKMQLGPWGNRRRSSPESGEAGGAPGRKGGVVWTSLGPLPRWVPGPTTRWAPGTTRLALHGT